MSPPLSERVNLLEYAQKVSEKADTLFIKNSGEEIASCSIYCNREVGFITSIAVKEEYHKQHIGSEMLKEVKDHARKKGCNRIKLEVYRSNFIAINFYIKNDFNRIKSDNDWIIMECKII